MMPCKLVAYYRVSTGKQGKSGLGLSGQRAAVLTHEKATGCKLVAEYTEVETGKGKGEDRPELQRAIAHANFARATLVIAKMDRLTRNLAFLTRLEEGKVDFTACDMPNASKMTIRIMVMVAEDELERISERTRAGLAAYRAENRLPNKLHELYPNGIPDDVLALYEPRRGLLGASLPECRNLTPEGRQRGAEKAGRIHAETAEKFNGFIAPRIHQLREGGLTLQAIADTLNAEGVRTRRDREWSHVQIRNILKRSRR
jgi:DNA invertase Pin-like site-specific DNA recombinase